MARRKSNNSKIDTGRWLTTYADMMNNLLVLFMVLYAMSVMNLKKFNALAEQFSNILTNNPQTQVSVNLPAGEIDPNTVKVTQPAVPSEQNKSSADKESAAKFDSLYEKIKKGIEDNGYTDLIEVEKEDAFIKFKFKDSVLFFADSSEIKPAGIGVLKYVGDLLIEVDKYTENIEIGGHTAQVGTESNNNFYAWELSSNRAISVLKYLVQNCGLAQSKMLISGYSHYAPVGDNSTENGRSVNRRVEIKIIRVSDETKTE